MNTPAHSKSLKVALVHDWLNTKIGGGERVLFELAKLYPNAPIYTLLFDADKFKGLVDPKRVHVSSLQKYPAILRRRPRYLLPLVPKAVESFDFTDYDVVISSSSAFVKNIITRTNTIHICYCHSPMRFAWDYWPHYIDEQKVGPIRAYFIGKQISKLRLWDFYGSARVDKWIANSSHVAQRIKKYYRKSAQIIYPPVDTELFHQNKAEKQNYYVTLSALTPYKKIDLAIETFNQRGDKLIVLSDGPERSKLEKQAKANIHFKGHVSDVERAKILSGAKGLIFPNEEDFGIAMVEALAAGTPVIAYRTGGAQEIVDDGRTGVLFDKQTAHSLHHAIDKLEKLNLKPAELQKQAERFNQSVFNQNIVSFVEKAVSEYVASN